MSAAGAEAGATEVFRHCGPHHSDLDQTLAHAKALGGRYNPPGEFGAVYVGATRGDALRELDRRARSARRAGFEAIRFPSFGGDGVNYAVFLDRLKPGASLRVVSEQVLDEPDQEQRS